MNKLTLTNIEGFLIKKVTRFGNGAKVDCPKQYLGKTVYIVVVMKNGSKERTAGCVGKNSKTGKRKQGTQKTK